MPEFALRTKLERPFGNHRLQTLGLTKQPPKRSSKGNFFVRVRFGGIGVRLRRLSEYGSVACSVERPPQETPAEQYSGTVLSSVSMNVLWSSKMITY